MKKVELKNGKIALVGQFMTIVYNNEAEYNQAQAAVKASMERCCPTRGINNRMVNGKKVCGWCN